MGAAADFLSAFNDLEDFFTASLEVNTHTKFAALLQRYDDKHHLPRSQLAALRAFASLRNAISHGTYRDGRPIAQPLLETVREMQRIRDLVMRPPTAMSVLEVRGVCTVSPRDKLSEALRYVREFDFSQLPMYDGSTYVGLLTTNTIARWLAAQFVAYDAMAGEERLAEVVKFAEVTDRAVQLPKVATVVDVVRELTEDEDDGAPPPTAVIFTAGGGVDEEPLGVAVAADLPVLIPALKLA